VRLVLVAVLVVVACAMAGRWVVERWSHVFVDDSRIAANLVTVSSEVNGRVTAIPVIAGDKVEKDQLLAGIDRKQVLFELDALDAQIAGVVAQQEQLRTQQDMIRNQVAKKTDAAQSQIRAAEANHRASEAMLQNARGNFQRAKSLAERKVATEQDLETARAALETAEQQERVTAADIDTARANLAVTESDADQIGVLEKQIATLETQKSALIAEREQKRVDLSHREIHAGFDGVIDSVFVDDGEYVSPGSRLLIYHDPNVIWVDANVKETDFERVKPGAHATIEVDAYPDMTFAGKVVRMGQAATSEFALLPSPNPSGNFTKVTQRLPIRISIEQHNGLLRPGMMVEVSIDVVD
jgi:membrane fusion protein (multidrug efflux system)